MSYSKHLAFKYDTKKGQSLSYPQAEKWSSPPWNDDDIWSTCAKLAEAQQITWKQSGKHYDFKDNHSTENTTCPSNMAS